MDSVQWIRPSIYVPWVIQPCSSTLRRTFASLLATFQELWFSDFGHIGHALKLGERKELEISFFTFYVQNFHKSRQSYLRYAIGLV
jgi:hypothetical protein